MTLFTILVRKKRERIIHSKLCKLLSLKFTEKKTMYFSLKLDLFEIILFHNFTPIKGCKISKPIETLNENLSKIAKASTLDKLRLSDIY